MVGMKNTKGQRGRTIELTMLIALIVLIVAIIIPNFMNTRDDRHPRSCVQSLGTWRKLMAMYANDNKSELYPVELNAHRGVVDEKLLNAFSQYTNITNTLKDCTETYFSVTKSSYTISATAKDRKHTLLTATLNEVTIP